MEGEYRPLAVAEGASGALPGHSAALGLDFGVAPGLELRRYDPATGARLRNHREAEADLRREAAVRPAAEAELQRRHEQSRQLRPEEQEPVARARSVAVQKFAQPRQPALQCVALRTSAGAI